jgi:hypothetical protein
MSSTSTMPFDEGEVGFEFQGKTYVAHGAQVDERHCIGYLGDNDALLACGGSVLGRYRITATWHMPRTCWISSRQHQVTATVEGRTYTGRSFGKGMIFKGHRVACELRIHGLQTGSARRGVRHTTETYKWHSR